MKCEDLAPLLTRTPRCVDGEAGAIYTTDCLYPSADPVRVFVERSSLGFIVSDGGGALRSALVHGRDPGGIFAAACARHSVDQRGGMLIAHPPSEEWLYAAILAVANASAMAARAAVDASVGKTESRLHEAIFIELKKSVPESKIGRNYLHRGRSGHSWNIDFAVTEEALVLVKSVVQNGNSINSNYAAFGDIGDNDSVSKLSVFEDKLKQDTGSLIRQVATLVPLSSVASTVQARAYRSRLN